jgi:hypothetical protein
VSGTLRQPDSATQTQKQKSPVSLRPSWSQVAIMFVCTIPVAAIATGVGMAIAVFLANKFDIKAQSDASYVLVLVLSPGLFLAGLIEPSLPPAGPFNFRGIIMGFLFNFLIYFGIFFSFVLWADRRWRLKRAAPRSANE